MHIGSLQAAAAILLALLQLYGTLRGNGKSKGSTEIHSLHFIISKLNSQYFLFQNLTSWISLLKSPYIYQKQPSEVYVLKGVLKIYSKFTGEYPCRRVISIKMFCNFIEITLRHGYSPVTLLHIFRTPFPKNTSERLLLINVHCRKFKHEGVKQNLALRVKIMSKYPRGEFHPSLQDRGKIRVGLRFYFGWACIQEDKFDQRQGWNSPQVETTCNVPLKKVFLKISQNSQENNCARHSFRPQASNFTKIEIRAQVFSCKFCESFKNTVFYRTSLVAASAWIMLHVCPCLIKWDLT